MLWLLLLLAGAAQTVYTVVEMSKTGFTLTPWIAALLCFAVAEVIRRQNQNEPEEEKQLRSGPRHPVER